VMRLISSELNTNIDPCLVQKKREKLLAWSPFKMLLAIVDWQ